MLPAPPPPPALFEPPCPVCRTPLRVLGLDGEEHGRESCGTCTTPISYTLFPARRRTRRAVRVERSVEGDSTCYFHPSNQAATVCDDCGRYLCAVCELPSEDGRRLCPPCVSASRKKTTAKADELVTYDDMALLLAVLPILMWPFTLLTAPATLGLVIWGWRKPRSLVRPNRWRLIVAGILAVLQIGGWITLAVNLWLDF